MKNIAKQAKTLEIPEIKYDEPWDSNECFVHHNEQFKENMISIYKRKSDELKTKINGIVELNSLGMIDDNEFYYDLKKNMEDLGNLNNTNVVLDERALQIDESDTTELDRVIKNLQSQLLEAKADNISTFQKLQCETESYIINEQEEYLSKQENYIKKWVVPLKAIHSKLLEEWAALE